MNDPMTAKNPTPLLPIGVTAVSALALVSLLLAWGIGGTHYFKDALLGEFSLPVLLALCAAGGLAAYRKSHKTA